MRTSSSMSHRGCARWHLPTTKMIRLASLVLLAWISLTSSLSPERVATWAGLMSNRLLNFTEEVLTASAIKQSYMNLSLQLEEASGENLVTSLSNQLEHFLQHKDAALQNLAQQAASAEMDFVDNTSELIYFNGKDLKDTLPLEFDPHFGVEVNLNFSIVHVPTDIYDKGEFVARDIKWSQRLDAVFRENFLKYPGLSWQYFGSAEGIHRQYPGRQWPMPPDGVPDLYDARRRPWYIQGASSQKDVVILIDRSGSLLGLRIEIAKLAASVIVETLTTNDFFHVILFNNHSEYICCSSRNENGTDSTQLLQATRGNKEYVKGILKEVTASSISDWRAGLEMGFRLLQKSKQYQEGSRCQRALVILSDGAAEYHRDIFRMYNQDKEIRVFTYVVGPQQYSVKELKQMACENKGYFLRIPSIGAVWETVTSYMRVLSRPIGLADVKPTTFTSVFVDATGSGLVSTGSTPVFSTKEGKKSRLLGVIATDVLVKDLSEFIKPPLIGHNGYIFALDNNGLILIHPGINGEKLAKLNPQPNMDFDELEFAVQNQTLVYEMRNSMIDAPSATKGTASLDAFIMQDGELRVQKDRMEYHFIRSSTSPFSIGIASPEYGFIVKSPIVSYKDGINLLKNVSRIKRWPYCSKLRMEKGLKSALIKKLEDAVLTGTDPTNCDSLMLNGLLIDADATEHVVGQWESRRQIMERNEVSHVHIRTHWGVIRYLTTHESLGNDSVSNLPYVERVSKAKEKDLSVARWDFYSRAVRRSHQLTVAVHAPEVDKGEGDFHISIHQPIKLERQKVVVAVAGLEMNLTKFADEFFIKSSMKCEDDEICDRRETCDRSQRNQVEGLYCYILDENGFIVSSNEQEDTGLFFGLVDPLLMLRLLQKENGFSLYDKIVLPDYQASCRLLANGKHLSNADVIAPFRFITSFMLWTMQSLTFLLSKLASLSFYSITSVLSSASSVDISDLPFTYVNCVKNATVYLADHGEAVINIHGNATCVAEPGSACFRTFAVSSVPQTNLFFLVVTSNCGKCKSEPGDNLPVPGKNSEVVFTEPRYKKPSGREKKRRDPGQCFAPAEEDNSECGLASGLTPSWLTMIACLLLLLHGGIVRGLG